MHFRVIANKEIVSVLFEKKKKKHIEKIITELIVYVSFIK